MQFHDIFSRILQVRELRRAWNVRGKYTFINRQKGAPNVVIVLIGYKPKLWNSVVPRIQRALAFDPSLQGNFDVCLVTPGQFKQEVAEIAAKNGWSYLHTKANRVSLAQNLAVKVHPEAKLIYKLDEDIFLPEFYFQEMQRSYARVKEEGRYRVGFCAPLLNVNGYSYIPFLERLGLTEQYRQEFGELMAAAYHVKIQHDPAACRWIWERTLPFDNTAQRILDQGFHYTTIPHRFSIGAILMERPFWEKIGGMHNTLAGGPKTLGSDEDHLCRDCVGLSHVMICFEHILAGHFSFGPQDAGMKPMLPAIESDTLASLESNAAAGANKLTATA
jgi:hypothetical protein